MSNRSQILETLRRRVRALEADCRTLGCIVSTGCDAFDNFLGTGGFERGSLVEWIGMPGSGAATLALMTAQEACGKDRLLVVLDGTGQFYPPAVHALGIDLCRTLVIQPRNTADYHWSLIQILRSPDVATVMCWPNKLQERMLRRLQLAAEHGQTLGLLVRPVRAAHEPTWARVRLLVEAQSSPNTSRRWRVTNLSSQTLPNETIELEMDDESGKLQPARPVRMAPSLATPTSLRRSS